ncbi:hypothetical protein HHK36_013373 [Tetracentron sinense]|uniref:Polygalacturonase n=1 Tax=Tetracentron sinense TaxID=13715 RepID=A0A835DGD7_TETSI|nr:hypothetical protein HHK36_013373 [Tetracentron sinense]
MAMKVLLAVLFLIIFFSLASGGDYNVVDYGAKGDAKTDTTRSFLSAWASACSSVKPARIYVPHGRYLIKQAAEFRGPCKNNATTIRIDGTLVAPSDYRILGSSDTWLLFIKVTGVSVYGGTLDGQGSGLWACKKAGKNCPAGTRSLTFNYAKDIVINGLTSMNSQVSHIVINSCQNVMVQGLKIVAPEGSPNTDGIHIQTSTGVTITGTSMNTGDDCISIGPGATNLWIQRVNCGPGHGISIGSLGKDLVEQGVQNVTVKNAVFTGTQNGLRIKSWARPSKGFVRRVLYEDATMKNVKNPIIIDQNYCPGNEGCPDQLNEFSMPKPVARFGAELILSWAWAGCRLMSLSSATSIKSLDLVQSSGIKISEVTYKNIQGTSETEVAVKFDCSMSNPCRDIKLQDVKLSYHNNSPAQSSCLNADGAATGLMLPSSCL